MHKIIKSQKNRNRAFSYGLISGGEKRRIYVAKIGIPDAIIHGNRLPHFFVNLNGRSVR